MDKIKYKGNKEKLIEGYYNDIGAEVQYIGEDGNMVCVADNKEDALKLFRKRMIDDVGEPEADEIKIDDIGVGYLFLVNKDNPAHERMVAEDCTWYVSWSDKEVSDYEVFVYLT